MKLKSLPPAWAALARKGNARLLMAEARTLKALRADTKAAIQSARASILIDRMRTIDAMRATVPAISDAVRTNILVGRIDAKKRASETMDDELALADVDEDLEDPALVPNDHARAEAIAASFVAAWLMTGLALDAKKSKDPALESLILIDFRIRRIAGTEIPQAYGAWHTDLADSLATELLVQRWDATLDRKTCALCAGMDGEIAPLHGAFRDGLIPGAVHVNCRCEPTLIPAYLVMKEAA